MKQLLATKSLKWKNEEEIRIVTDIPGLHYKTIAQSGLFISAFE